MIARNYAKEITLDDLFSRFHPDVHDRIKAQADRPDVEAIVVLQVLQMDSSQAGHVQALAVGSGCTWTLDYVLNTPHFRTGDVPSRFHYPVAYTKTKKEKSNDT